VEQLFPAGVLGAAAGTVASFGASLEVQVAASGCVYRPTGVTVKLALAGGWEDIETFFSLDEACVDGHRHWRLLALSGAYTQYLNKFI
jgi:hypothetical protein